MAPLILCCPPIACRNGAPSEWGFSRYPTGEYENGLIELLINKPSGDTS
jgi:hypothetical protein